MTFPSCSWTKPGLKKVSPLRLRSRSSVEKGPVLLKAGTPDHPGKSAGSGGKDATSFRSELEQTPRILLVRLRSLGDSILTLPLVEALHEWRPELQLDILIESPFAAVFRRQPAVHGTLVLAPRNRCGTSGWSKQRALFEVLRRRYPVVINLHGGTTSLLFCALSMARSRVGYEHYRYSQAYNVRIPSSRLIWGRDGIHTVEHLLAMTRWLGIPVRDEPRCNLYLEEEARDRVRARLRSSGIRPGEFFLVHPTATLHTKQWPSARFAGLADQLFREYGLPVVFTAAPNEGQALLDIGQNAKERYHYWSDLPLDELFALIESCLLFVGNDSGPTHAAAALRKPVIAIWGSSDLRAWHPWGTDSEVIHSSLPCMPCPGYSCAAFGEPKCILGIQVESVLQACRRLMGRISGAPRRL